MDDAEAADRVGSLSERQLYNLTCIYALAVAQLELDAGGGRGPLQQQRIAVYEHRAVAGLRRTLDSARREKRPAFWQKQVQNDPALTAIRGTTGYRELAARYGRPR